MTSDRDPLWARASWAPRNDGSRPQTARVYDHLLGGKDNFAEDRTLGDAMIARMPTLPELVRAQRAFLGRAVRYLVAEAGLRQFLDIGTGLPAEGSVIDVAHGLAREARVVCIDNDPIVLTHARAFTDSTGVGATTVLQADLRDPMSLVGHPELGVALDLTRPVGVLLVGVLHHLKDTDQPYRAVTTVLDRLAVGSHLAIGGPASDLEASATAEVARVAQRAGITYRARSREETLRFFDGLQPVEPGVVRMDEWRPDVTDAPAVAGWAGLGRKVAPRD